MSDPLLNVMKIMLLAGLYLFFVRVLWAVYTELRDPRTRVARRPEPTPAAPPISGEVPSGKAKRSRRESGKSRKDTAVIVGQLIVTEPAAMAGVTYALANEITIGRSPTCGIRIDDGYVSPVHARVFSVDGRFVVEDLGSSNGSSLNGEPIRSTEDAAFFVTWIEETLSDLRRMDRWDDPDHRDEVLATFEEALGLYQDQAGGGR